MKKGAAVVEKQDCGRERTMEGRRMLTFTFCREVGGDLTDKIMEKLADNAQTSSFLRYLYTYKIKISGIEK